MSTEKLNDYEKLIKELQLKKDVSSLDSAIFEQKKLAIEAEKRQLEIEARLADLAVKREKKQAELDNLL